MRVLNSISMDTVCASLAYAIGIEPPVQAAPPAQPLVQYIDDTLSGKKVDRIFMYNPDAISQWVCEKYPYLIAEVVDHTELALPLCTVMPSVTPVCFGTMYTGTQPEIHGIQEYTKPVIRTDSLFDAMIRAGKKCAIVSNPQCSMNLIYREREMDYFEGKDADEVNAIASKLILEDQYDLLVVYNGNYDYRQHRCGPEGLDALTELKCNNRAFHTFIHMLQNNWQHHNTLVGFAMDHGSHTIEPLVKKNGTVYNGNHGDAIPEDLNVVHRYQILKATK
jgi:hypothetical protein